MRLLLIILLAAITSGLAVADSHGNDFAHSRTNNGQIYIMYKPISRFTPTRMTRSVNRIVMAPAPKHGHPPCCPQARRLVKAIP